MVIVLFQALFALNFVLINNYKPIAYTQAICMLVSYLHTCMDMIYSDSYIDTAVCVQ